jgi:hypothetical protein
LSSLGVREDERGRAQGTRLVPQQVAIGDEPGGQRTLLRASPRVAEIDDVRHAQPSRDA